MSRPLIGQLLSQMGKLSSIDVDEILVEQAVTQRQFGEIALSWGLCDAEHLCEAWCSQLAEQEQPAHPAAIAVESDAARSLPPELVRRLGVVPIRNIGNQLVVATGRTLDSAETAEVVRAARKDVRFVRADARQIQKAIKRYYPAQAPP